MIQLSEHITSYFDCSPEIANDLEAQFNRKHLKKGDFLSRQGQYQGELAFVVSGYVRIYRLREGKEYTQWISGPGEFVTDLANLVFDQPARWNIHVLTDCELYVIPSSRYDQLVRTIPGWTSLEKLFLAKCFMIMEDRIFSFLSLSAEERYDWLFEERRDLVNQVPLQYQASMLGMSPETFSRIRNKKALRKSQV